MIKLIKNLFINKEKHKRSVAEALWRTEYRFETYDYVLANLLEGKLV
jgi:hypothetical protein